MLDIFIYYTPPNFYPVNMQHSSYKLVFSSRVENSLDVENSGSFGRVLDWGSKGCSFETCQSHCVVSLSKTLYLLLSTDSTKEDGKSF